MASPKYLDFDLQIAPGSNNGYRARVLDSPAGQAAVDFVPPFGDDEVALFVEQLLLSNNRQSSLFEKGMLRTFGSALFDALFHGALLACLGRSLDEAQRQGAGLRLKLRLSDTPALVNLPWEYLYYATANRFLTLSTATPLVHFVELPEPLRPFIVTPPVCILVLFSAPDDLAQLDIEKEWSNLQSALHKLVEGQQVTLVRLHNPTLTALQQALRQHETHVLHFIGHGAFDPASRDGLLAFCGPDGKAEMVNAQDFGKLLHNERSLRLVVLNVCEGSRTSVEDPFAGTAQTLVQQGVPAVIAMQFVISDQAAINFSQEFYAALADGYPVDAAVSEARVAIATRLRGGEWGAPKLFMRAADGMLWQLRTPSPAGGTPVAGPGELVDQGLNSLVELLQSTAVRDRVMAFRADFEAATQQLDILIRYKELHDALHELQFRCYNVIVREASRFPDDALGLDNLLSYEVTLQTIAARLEPYTRQSAIPASELAWLADVRQAQNHLNEAINQLDSQALKRAVWLLKRVIALQPSSINQRLNVTARALRLGALVDALSAIQAALSSLPLDRTRLAQFESGVEALRSLDARLTTLVEAHNRWQAVERMLSRIEDVIAYDLTELEFSWPDVQMRVNALCQDNQEEWVSLLAADGSSLSQALGAKNPALVHRCFQRYRQRAGHRFYQVDIMLKTHCEEVRKVGEPIASVLKILD
jgi:hypothetical protein